jgi:hypothetical protein
MLQEADIRGILAPVVKAKSKGKPYSDFYGQAVKDADEIRVHADGNFPDNLIADRAPSETPEEFEYRKACYEPTTQATWDKAVTQLNSVWHGVTITTDDEEAQEYLTGGYPSKGGLVHWLGSVMSPRRPAEPNSVVYVTVKYVPRTESGSIDDTQPLPAYAALLRTEQVIELEPEYLLAELDETSALSDGKPGVVFMLIDDSWEYQIRQVGKQHEWKFEIFPVYEHGLGRVPAYRLGGRECDFGGEILYKSIFQQAVPFLNKAAVESSSQDASIIRTAFPTRVYFEEDCDECDGKGKQWDEDTGASAVCDSCNGSGKSKGFTPFRDYTHTPPGRLDGNEPIPFPGFQYVSPDMAPAEFLEKRIDSQNQKALVSIHMDLIRPAGETATRVREDQQQHFKKVSEHANACYLP